MTLNQRLGKGIFDIFLQRAPQRPGAIRAIGAGLFDDPLLGFVGQPDFEAVPQHRLVDLFDLQLNHVEQLVIEQFVKDDDFIEAVDEFRIEGLLAPRTSPSLPSSRATRRWFPGSPSCPSFE